MTNRAGAAVAPFGLTVLAADAGRPDATELSRVVASGFALSLGVTSPETGDPVFAPRGSVARMPSTALELAPGDPSGLAAAGKAWRHVQSDAPQALTDDLLRVARDASRAHLTLAERLQALQERAAHLYSDAEALGIPSETLGSQARIAERVARDPAFADLVAAPVHELIAVRLDWVDATNGFIDDLASARERFGIPDW